MQSTARTGVESDPKFGIFFMELKWNRSQDFARKPEQNLELNLCNNDFCCFFSLSTNVK